jgi:hydroxyacylglutathione hydrolase
LQILPTVHKVDNVPGANCYLVEIENGVLVVDTGMPGQVEKILAGIRSIGRGPEDVKWILLTHADLDHSGSAAPLRECTGAKIAAHPAEAQVLSGELPGKQPKGLLRLVFAIIGVLLPARAPFSADHLLTDGEMIAGWKVVFAPGHTAGSICLYKEGTALFAGDAIRCDRKGNPRPPSSAMSGNMDLAWRSVAALAQLNFKTLLPGHGAVCLQAGSRKVAEMVRRHAEKTR